MLQLYPVMGLRNIIHIILNLPMSFLLCMYVCILCDPGTIGDLKMVFIYVRTGFAPVSRHVDTGN